MCAKIITSNSGRRRNKNGNSIEPPGSSPTGASVEHELPQAGLFVQPAVEMNRVEPRQLDLVDHGGLRSEQLASDHAVVPSSERSVELELPVLPRGVAAIEDSPLLAFRNQV